MLAGKGITTSKKDNKGNWQPVRQVERAGDVFKRFERCCWGCGLRPGVKWSAPLQQCDKESGKKGEATRCNPTSPAGESTKIEFADKESLPKRRVRLQRGVVGTGGNEWAEERKS